MSDADADEDPSAPPKTGGPPVRVALQWAALEHTRGASPEVVRTICRNMTSDWLVVVQSLNFTPREYKFTLTQPSVAKELVEAFQGEMTQEGRTYHVRYLAKPQAFSLDMPYVWMCAAIAGDRDLARQVAQAYQLHEPHQMRAQFEIREAILRHLLADDDDSAAALTARLEDGYPTGQTPQRIEFPRGVVEKDEALILNGIKTITAKFETMWDEKKYRKWHEKQMARRPKLTWEQVLEDARRDLVSSYWVVSWWAVAFLNVARWRCLESVFSNKKAFSEWVPLELCR